LVRMLTSQLPSSSSIEPSWRKWFTTRNIHFYDENVNDESEIIIEERFLWRIFLFRHRSVVTILQPSLSMMKSGIVTKIRHRRALGFVIDHSHDLSMMISFKTVTNRASSLN
jgi:hypothetical protein